MAVNEDSILAGVVTLENQFTQLLCNFMLRDQVFKNAALRFLFGSQMARRLSKCRMKTQVDLGEYGRPDLVFTASDAIAILEVKVDAQCPLTQKETPTCKSGYLAYLARSRRKYTAIAYLVPENWTDLERVKSFPCPRWGKLIKLVAENPDPVLAEFRSILTSRFGEILFDKKEADRMLDKSFPMDEALKIFAYISQVKQEYGIRSCLVSDKNECGFNLSKGGIWFGCWKDFFHSHQYPIGFGMEADPNLPAKSKAFRTAYQREFGRSAIAFKEGPWFMGYLNQEELETVTPKAMSDRLKIIFRHVQAAK